MKGARGKGQGASASVGQSASASMIQRCQVRCVRWGVFCCPFLSVCTGDISTKAMVGVDVVVQVDHVISSKN